MVTGTENAINELSSVGNRYRDGWGLMAPARAERPPSSSRRGSGLGKQHCKRAGKLIEESENDLQRAPRLLSQLAG